MNNEFVGEEVKETLVPTAIDEITTGEEDDGKEGTE
jgi:hypothetical protein